MEENFLKEFTEVKTAMFHLREECQNRGTWKTFCFWGEIPEPREQLEYYSRELSVYAAYLVSYGLTHKEVQAMIEDAKATEIVERYKLHTLFPSLEKRYTMRDIGNIVENFKIE